MPSPGGEPAVVSAPAAETPAVTFATVSTEGEAALQRLLRLVSVAICLFLFLGIGTLLAVSYTHFARDAAYRTLVASAELEHQSESLTLALNASIASGRSSAQYQGATTAFTGAMKRLTDSTPDGSPQSALASQVTRACWDRLSLEKRAIALASSGQTQSATALVASDGYATKIAGISQNLAQMANAQKDQLTSLSFWERIGLWSASGLAIIAASLLLMLGIPSGRRLTLWRRAISNQLRERQKAQEQLTVAQTRLERELRDRSSDLAMIRSELEEQVSLRRGSDAERNLLTQAVQSANDVVMITLAEEGAPPRVVYVNQAFERMTGYTREEIIGKSPQLLQGPLTDRATLDYIRVKLRAREPVQVELQNYRKNNTTFWVELNIRPIRDETGFQTHWISIQRDITERKQAEDKILWQATHDELTHMPNRALYQDRLAEAVALAQQSGSSVGVLFFDLDRFKHINDTLGHTVGDRLLQEVAKRLQQRLRPEDTIARIGGDEFAVLLPYHDVFTPAACAAASEIAAQRLLDGLDSSFTIDGHELFITASIGISIAPQDGTAIETLLKRADIAMYRAKDQGRDSYRIYNETMSARSLDRLLLETNLRRALDRNEFYLLYQPQVNLISGRIYGVEALIRWENPQLGLVSPGQFISLAEETGLILPIGAWALREACLQTVRWHEAGRALRISVNLSARQFQQQDLVLMIATVLQETGLDPQWLDLELTESTLLQEKEALAILTALKAIGVRLSVDDFGTGYSQFSYLRTFPFDVLKIDRSFIVDLLEDRKSEAVVRNLVGMAHDVGLQVVVEGVETDMQRVALQSMGCEAVQGYLFSPPTTPAEVLRLADEAEHMIDKDGKRLVLATAKNPPAH